MSIADEPIDGFGWWEEHPQYPIDDWKYAVNNDETRMGYWAWVSSILEEVFSVDHIQ